MRSIASSVLDKMVTVIEIKFDADGRTDPYYPQTLYYFTDPSNAYRWCNSGHDTRVESYRRGPIRTGMPATASTGKFTRETLDLILSEPPIVLNSLRHSLLSYVSFVPRWLKVRYFYHQCQQNHCVHRILRFSHSFSR